jgi:hypothetical protein
MPPTAALASPESDVEFLSAESLASFDATFEEEFRLGEGHKEIVNGSSSSVSMSTSSSTSWFFPEDPPAEPVVELGK